jgi:hypothetical protein
MRCEWTYSLNSWNKVNIIFLSETILQLIKNINIDYCKKNISFHIRYNIWLFGVINGNGIWFTSTWVGRGGAGLKAITGLVWIGEMIPFLMRIGRIGSKCYFQLVIRNKNDSLFVRIHTHEMAGGWLHTRNGWRFVSHRFPSIATYLYLIFSVNCFLMQ